MATTIKSRWNHINNPRLLQKQCNWTILLPDEPATSESVFLFFAISQLLQLDAADSLLVLLQCCWINATQYSVTMKVVLPKFFRKLFAKKTVNRCLGVVTIWMDYFLGRYSIILGRFESISSFFNWCNLLQKKRVPRYPLSIDLIRGLKDAYTHIKGNNAHIYYTKANGFI